MDSLAIGYWSILALLNLAVGNLAFGTFCCTYVVTRVLLADDED